MKLMLPTFSTFVKRVFDGCQKLFWLFSKALLTVVKNYQNFTSLFMNLFCNACGILLIYHVTMFAILKMAWMQRSQSQLKLLFDC